MNVTPASLLGYTIRLWHTIYLNSFNVFFNIYCHSLFIQAWPRSFFILYNLRLSNCHCLQNRPSFRQKRGTSSSEDIPLTFQFLYILLLIFLPTPPRSSSPSPPAYPPRPSTRPSPSFP